MIRAINQLKSNVVDLLVIGGGISGAAIAWDASLRGLRVALIEKGDFGCATSSNSMKTVHGGLRYLQDLDIKLIRKMIRERTTYMRIAPHLVYPLPFMMPSYKGKVLKSLFALGAAVKINDMLSYDRNKNLQPSHYLQSSKVIGRHNCQNILYNINSNKISGAVIWNDAQIFNTERLVLSFILSAARYGALLANYVEAMELLISDNTVTGVKAKDILNDFEFEIKARLVVNATGLCTNNFIENNTFIKCDSSVAVNIVTKKLYETYAFGLEINDQVYFISPWQDYSIIGTIHYIDDKQDTDLKTRLEIFLKELNSMFHDNKIEMKDIIKIHKGSLPIIKNHDQKKINLIRDSIIIDHERIDKLNNFITAIGVKYTTARDLAERTVDLVCQKFKTIDKKCLTKNTALTGGNFESLDKLNRAINLSLGKYLTNKQMKLISCNYGDQYRFLQKYIETDPNNACLIDSNHLTIKAEVIHAVRHEMAQKLSDIVFRRTDLSLNGIPRRQCLYECATIMADLLNWDEKRKFRELDEVFSYSLF
jgi:glycerol-3-phosphate dehydrogenase